MGYAATMSFTPRELDLLATEPELEIETTAPDGPPHRTTIWAVVEDGQVFIRSWRGSRARWYREARANPAVALHVGGQRLTATAIPATDPDAVERTSEALRRKYPGDPSTPDMLRPEILDTTLRLEPA
jgi:hypothetical protein